MSDSINLEAAMLEAKAARARLLDTAQTLQARLDPAKILEEAVSGVKSNASGLAQNAGAAVRRRPDVAAGIAAALVLLVARRPILRLVRRIIRRR